ncbi:MAG TPA: insulinase family protein, partial [Azonexus sp.]|nr:insulinase family protein [Azonexus sp.]
LQTKRSQAREAIKVAQDVLDGFLKDGPTAEELTAAKANLTGSFPLRLDSNKKLLDNIAAIGFYGLPLDYLDQYQAKVQAVSADAIRQAFARHVRKDGLVTVTVAAD